MLKKINTAAWPQLHFSPPPPTTRRRQRPNASPSTASHLRVTQGPSAWVPWDAASASWWTGRRWRGTTRPGTPTSRATTAGWWETAKNKRRAAHWHTSRKQSQAWVGSTMQFDTRWHVKVWNCQMKIEKLSRKVDLVLSWDLLRVWKGHKCGGITVGNHVEWSWHNLGPKQHRITRASLSLLPTVHGRWGVCGHRQGLQHREEGTHHVHRHQPVTRLMPDVFWQRPPALIESHTQTCDTYRGEKKKNWW